MARTKKLINAALFQSATPKSKSQVAQKRVAAGKRPVIQPRISSGKKIQKQKESTKQSSKKLSKKQQKLKQKEIEEETEEEKEQQQQTPKIYLPKKIKADFGNKIGDNLTEKESNLINKLFNEDAYVPRETFKTFLRFLINRLFMNRIIDSRTTFTHETISLMLHTTVTQMLRLYQNAATSALFIRGSPSIEGRDIVNSTRIMLSAKPVNLTKGYNIALDIFKDMLKNDPNMSMFEIRNIDTTRKKFIDMNAQERKSEKERIEFNKAKNSLLTLEEKMNNLTVNYQTRKNKLINEIKELEKSLGQPNSQEVKDKLKSELREIIGKINVLNKYEPDVDENTQEAIDDKLKEYKDEEKELQDGIDDLKTECKDLYKQIQTAKHDKTHHVLLNLEKLYREKKQKRLINEEKLTLLNRKIKTFDRRPHTQEKKEEELKQLEERKNKIKLQISGQTKSTNRFNRIKAEKQLKDKKLKLRQLIKKYAIKQFAYSMITPQSTDQQQQQQQLLTSPSSSIKKNEFNDYETIRKLEIVSPTKYLIDCHLTKIHPHNKKRQLTENESVKKSSSKSKRQKSN